MVDKLPVEAQLVELPGGRLYKDSVYLEPLRHGDIKEIFIIAKNNDERRMVSLLKRRIHGVDIKDVTPQDMWFVMYWQRINSYPSNPMRIKWKCQHCGNITTSPLHSSNLSIKDLDAEYQDGLGLQLPSRERAGASPVYLRLNRVGDDTSVRKYYSDNNLFPDDGDLKEGLMACMLEPTGGSFEERMKLVKTLNADDMFIIQEFENTFDYGVEPFGKFKCSKGECGEEGNVSFQFTLASFFPPLSDDGSIRTRILPARAPGSAINPDRRPGLFENDVLKRSETSGLQGNSRTESSGKVEVSQPVQMTESEVRAMAALNYQPPPGTQIIPDPPPVHIPNPDGPKVMEQGQPDNPNHNLPPGWVEPGPLPPGLAHLKRTPMRRIVADKNLEKKGP